MPLRLASHFGSHRWAVFGRRLMDCRPDIATNDFAEAYPIHTGGMSLTPAGHNGLIIYEMIIARRHLHHARGASHRGEDDRIQGL